jgi:hypothetical protein
MSDFQYNFLGQGFADFKNQSSQCFVCRKKTVKASPQIVWSLMKQLLITSLGFILNSLLFWAVVSDADITIEVFLLFVCSWAFSLVALIDHVAFAWKRFQLYVMT